MRNRLLAVVAAWAVVAASARADRLFDGRSFAGWEGDTAGAWRIENGEIVGGSLERRQQNNDFLCTTRRFGDFELRLKVKLSGTGGFVNSGIQFRSERVPGSHEVCGYQADFGAGHDGALYDESRRNRFLARPAADVLAAASRPGEWNDYRIRAEGPRIRLWLNGVETVDWSEPDDAAAAGVIALQIHGGAAAEVRFKDLEIEELGASSIEVPAFTAYVHPNPRGAAVTSDGISRWSDPATTIHWYGLFRTPGPIVPRVVLQCDADAVPRLSLMVGDEAHAGTITVGPPATIVFGTFTIAARGYVPLVLRLDEAPAAAVGVERIVVTGPAVVDAHFNLKERRNAASVHLAYPVDPQADVRALYSEVTAVEDPIHTFYMGCGWHRGYFGMQVNSPTERRIIFSVWDSGGEAVDRRKVADENRVRLVAKGEGVFSGDFGHEGTGGHSHLKHPWRAGEPQRFVVTSTPSANGRAIFAGYWFHPEERRWMLISAWDAPGENGRLRGLHGFSENFVGDTGDQPRKSLHGNQWYRTADGEWHEVTRATFSHDPTGRADRLDRFMGVEGGRFFLAHGGFREGFTRAGEAFDRPAGGRPPDDFDPPPLPGAKGQP